MSRVRNSVYNSLCGIIAYLVITLVAFISRKIFATVLGQEYLGLEGLFINIISMLSLSELGLSTAILFFLYEPVTKSNNEVVKTYMSFYKKIYRYIGSFIFIIGILITMNLKYIVKTELPLIQVQIYFVLFLLSTVVTYFYSYKKGILYADQNNRIISLIHMGMKICGSILQIIILIKLKSYIGYLMILIISNLIENILCSRIVDKKYPYLKEKNIVDLEKKQKKEIYYKVKGLVIQNISGFIVTSTDNIIISIFVNVISVGIYSNYILISQTLKTLFSQVYSAFTTSFGNLVVKEDSKKIYEVFEKVKFFSFWSISFCTVMYIVLIQPFIELWMGKEYLFSYTIAILIGISFYVTMMNVPFISMQNALGLHHLDQYIVILQAVMNLLISLVLVEKIGVIGIIIGTICSTIIFPTLSKPYIIYKNVFKQNVFKYYMEYIVQSSFMLIVCIIINTIFQTMYLEKGIGSFLLMAVIGSIIFNGIYIGVFFRKKEFKYFMELIINFIHKE